LYIITGLIDTSKILQTLCAGTPNSLLILYGHTEKIQPGVAVIHRDRSEEAYDNLSILKKEIIDVLNEISDWTMFDNIFLHGSFINSELDIIKQINEQFKDRFNLTISVHNWDNNSKNKWVIKEI